MSYPKPPRRSEGSISWLEVVLIILLILLILAIAIRLFGPFLQIELTRLCNQYQIPCGFLEQ
jgi:hypothetical protein